MRPALPFLLLAALGCGATSGTGPGEKPKPLVSTTTRHRDFRVHALYQGDEEKPTPLDELAVFLMQTPHNDEGLGLVGRVTNLDTKADYRPDSNMNLLELQPGRYRLELWYRVQKATFDEVNSGEKGLHFESLKSAEVAVLETTLEAGQTYFVEPRLLSRKAVPPDEAKKYYALTYGSTMEGVKNVPPKERRLTDWVWRPFIATLSKKDAAFYRSYR